jgi:hypothetical protein
MILGASFRVGWLLFSPLLHLCLLRCLLRCLLVMEERVVFHVVYLAGVNYFFRVLSRCNGVIV